MVGDALGLPTTLAEDGTPVAIVLSDHVQDTVANQTLKSLKRYERDLKADPRLAAAKASVAEQSAVLTRYVDGHLGITKHLRELLNNAIVARREAVAAKAARKAKADQERENKRIAGAREAEAKKLERAGARGTATMQREYKKEATAIREEELPDPDKAAERARVGAQKSMGKGGGSVVGGYEAIVDNLGELVAAVVASNDALFARARELRKLKLAPLPIEVLNAKRVSGMLVTSSWLSKHATATQGTMRIPGVIARPKQGTVRSV